MGYSLESNRKTIEGKKELGKAMPYGVSDLQHNEALVSVGISHDTAQFAVATILLWWNKIEHRLFCHITRNWRGVPLETLEIVVNLIAAARTTTGLEVHATLDEKDYPLKIKVSDAELEVVNIHRNTFHGEWNYEIRPH